MHDPPCLMQASKTPAPRPLVLIILQHAALTTYEACLIQCDVFRRARGMATCDDPPRPRGYAHIYPTFETRLPLKLSSVGSEAVRFDPSDVSMCSPKAVIAKPNLICGLCTRIKSFNGVVNLWSHLLRKHTRDRSDEERVVEVRRTARLWREYMGATRSVIGRAPTNRTSAMIAEVLREDFCWEVVAKWDLQ